MRRSHTTADKKRARARTDRLKIGEVAKRAGVAPSVINYYVSEGLLKKPVKTSRNMAYYDADTVEWIELIRELQETAFLPLKVIKKVVSSGSTPAEIRESFARRKPRLASVELESIDEEKLLARGTLTKQDLRKLEKMEVLSPKVQGGRRVYSADDACIVDQLERMRQAGLTPERGFRLDQMQIYRDAMEKLVEKEVQVAIEGIAGNMKGDDVAEVAGVWIGSANEIMRALHSKLVKRAVRQLSAGLKGNG